MKTSTFKRIALTGKPTLEGLTDMLGKLVKLLEARKCEIVVEQKVAALLPDGRDLKAVAADKLSEHADLVIVIGGDGSILHAGREAAPQKLPVLGINKGRLGFLTDISPDELDAIHAVLDGEYLEEKRMLLHAQMNIDGKTQHEMTAINDIVLLPCKQTHMIEFDVVINSQSVCRHRADGMIVATPTGSTAYALSAGGPILHPKLNAMVLVPLAAHTLSSRPLVISDQSVVEILITDNNEITPCVSADGQTRMELPAGSRLQIKRASDDLRLIHPKDYHYYETLKQKLQWKG